MPLTRTRHHQAAGAGGLTLSSRPAGALGGRLAFRVIPTLAEFIHELPTLALDRPLTPQDTGSIVGPQDVSVL